VLVPIVAHARIPGRAIVAAFSVRRLRIPRLLTVEPAAGPRRAG